MSPIEKATIILEAMIARKPVWINGKKVHFPSISWGNYTPMVSIGYDERIALQDAIVSSYDPNNNIVNNKENQSYIRNCKFVFDIK